MLLRSLLEAPQAGLVHLERYANVGSPSGFTAICAPSSGTSPAGPNDSFNLVLWRPPEARTSYFGDHEALNTILQPGEVLLHPDTVQDYCRDDCGTYAGFQVAPTASGRTVAVLNSTAWHLKLHYNRVLGRLDRSLGRRHAECAVHVSGLIGDHIRSGRLPDRFSILPESQAVVIETGPPERPREVGLVLRETVPLSRHKIATLVPAFSLFSADAKRPQDPVLALQLHEASELSAEDFLLHSLLEPLVDAYFALLLTLGIQGEFHAQNILFGWRAEHPSQPLVVMRDMESVDIDATLREALGLQLAAPPSRFKVISAQSDHYQRRHSLMYDFKFGEYLVAPLIAAFAERGLVDPERIDRGMKRFSEKYVSRLPPDFFPGEWYSFERVQIDRSRSTRPYVRNEKPRFR